MPRDRSAALRRYWRVVRSIREATGRDTAGSRKLYRPARERAEELGRLTVGRIIASAESIHRERAERSRKATASRKARAAKEPPAEGTLWEAPDPDDPLSMSPMFEFWDERPKDRALLARVLKVHAKGLPIFVVSLVIAAFDRESDEAEILGATEASFTGEDAEAAIQDYYTECRNAITAWRTAEGSSPDQAEYQSRLYVVGKIRWIAGGAE